MLQTILFIEKKNEFNYQFLVLADTPSVVKNVKNAATQLHGVAVMKIIEENVIFLDK